VLDKVLLKPNSKTGEIESNSSIKHTPPKIKLPDDDIDTTLSSKKQNLKEIEPLYCCCYWTSIVVLEVITLPLNDI
jgi:hypothetical protein